MYSNGLINCSQYATSLVLSIISKENSSHHSRIQARLKGKSIILKLIVYRALDNLDEEIKQINHKQSPHSDLESSPT